MKKLFPFLVLLASCSTVHKAVTTQKKTVDSVITTKADTSYKSSQTTRTDDFNVKDVDVTVTYGTPADSALVAAKTKPVDRTPMKTATGKKLDDFAAIIRDAVSNSGKAANIQSVTIHIGDISDSASSSSSTDTGSAHSSHDVKVQDQTINQMKTVTRTGLPWYIYVAAGLVGLIFLYKKFAV